MKDILDDKVGKKTEIKRLRLKYFSQIMKEMGSGAFRIVRDLAMD